MVEPASTGVLASLGIDWKLFLAQLVNFSVVAFVLWKWAFTPLMKALDERSKKIEASLADAKKIDERMKRIGAEEGAMMKEAHLAARAVVEEAEKAATEHRTAETEKTKQEVAKLLESGKLEMAAMKISVLREAKDDLADLVADAVLKFVDEKSLAKDHAALVQKVANAVAEKV